MAYHLDELKLSPNFGKFITKEKFTSYIGVPLIAKRRVVGVLEVYNRSPLRRESDWMDFLETLAGQAAIAIDNASLYQELQRSNEELNRGYDQTIEGWAFTLEMRDGETKGHSQRVTEMTISIAKEMGVKDEEIVDIRRGAILHDIGKIAIPDEILHKPGPLTYEEWDLMKQHPKLAVEWLSQISFLEQALIIPYYHHEKWDGTGYPEGLKGEEIPLSARIFAVVDVWDALLSDRPYRKAWSVEEALAHIKKQSGKHFDPEVVKVFLSLLG
jgi:putative nucleotidyltransferase with HDIG domain